MLQLPAEADAFCSIARFQQFKAFEKRILVATDIFGRGIDVERVNVVINYVRSVTGWRHYDEVTLADARFRRTPLPMPTRTFTE